MLKILKIISSFILLLMAIFLKFNNPLINDILFIISYIIVGLEIIIKALKNIFKGKIFDENFLMTVATIGAFIIDKKSEAVAVMLFYQIGEFLEDYAVDKSKKSIVRLMDIRPDYANLLVSEEIKKVNPAEVKIDDIIVVKPGEKIPLDGKVIEGNSSIDKKALTGEAMLQDIYVGDEVLSGSINVNGLIKIKVTKKFGESTVSKILNLVENVSSSKSKSENFITKFARFYTPVIVFLALFIALIFPLITKNSFSFWLYKSLAFLVVSCPCALVVSVPLSFFAGIGKASKMGILIKGSSYLESLTQVDTFIFDKTGTLTKGIFSVSKIKAIDISKKELLKYAAYAENYSTHPIAIAIKNAYKEDVDETKIKNVKELPGHGIEVKIANHNCLVGNELLMIENNIKYEKCLDEGTVLYIAINKKYQGYILITDELKKEAVAVINELNQNKEVIMLTGDQKKVGLNLAKKLNISQVFTDLLPQDKVKKVEDLLNNSNKKIAFIGDGINDAPVLALADVGIAMGSLGSDSAIEAADIVIMNDELSNIIKAIDISKETIKIVKENIVLAISIKVIILGLTFLGISSMWDAVFADVGVSLIAIFNALRLLKIKKKLT